MNTGLYLPTRLLSPFIKGYRIIESSNGLLNRVLPDTSLAIAFRFKGQVNYLDSEVQNPVPVSAVSGLRKTARLISYAKDTATLIVLFKEAGAVAFFKEPLHELFEQSVSLDNFVPGSKVSIIEEQLAEASNNNKRISIIEHFFLSRLFNQKVDRLIITALQEIHLAKGDVRIKELAGNLYISADAFEKRFRRAVGTSPKQFTSIVRMRSLIREKAERKSFTEVAFTAGYFDQPHFNKNFKLFTGQKPTEFFNFPSFW